MKIGEHTVSNYDVLVATPGKLIHYLEKFNLERLQYLVIDEADQMEGDWLKELESKVPSNCQKLLFSATLASDPQFLAALKVKTIMTSSMTTMTSYMQLCQLMTSYMPLNGHHIACITFASIGKLIFSWNIQYFTQLGQKLPQVVWWSSVYKWSSASNLTWRVSW